MKNYLVGILAAVGMIVTGCRPAVQQGGREVEQPQPPEQMIVEKGGIKTKTTSDELKIPLVNDGTWGVTASSVERAELGVAKAVDGNLATRWSSEFKDGQWLIVDFKKPELLNSITIHWEDAFARMFRVDLSLDGELWETILGERNGQGGRTYVHFDPRPARYVRVYCDLRGTHYGFSIYEIQFNNPEPPRITATASSGSGDYAARFAVDGDMKTRWSSAFRDGEWWQAEFDTPRILGGLKINWETAFSEKYEVAVSDDGGLWRTVYTVNDGDGQTDILFFGPVTTRFVRLLCHQRGTGWGNSIWEIAFLENSAAASASSATDGGEACRAVDGDPDSAWRSAVAPKQEWRVEFPQEFEIGGVELLWAEPYAVEYDVEVSADGEDWKAVYREEFGNGGTDYVFFPSSRAKFARIACKRSSGQGYALANFELKSGEEQITPMRAIQAAARNAPRGRYPMWLKRQQEFWTVTGLPDDNQETLIGETGTVEPYKGGFTVQPLIVMNKRIITWADVQISQSLEEGYLPLPTVGWGGDGWQMEIAALAIGKPGAAQTAVRYRFKNVGRAATSAQLVLAVRPVQLNPVWQHGGLSRIEKAEYRGAEKFSMLMVNGKIGLVLPTYPAKVGVSPITNGDITDFLDRGGLPDITMGLDSEGKVCAGIQYDLNVAPGETTDIVILLPLHSEAIAQPVWGESPSSAFEAAWNEARVKWTKMLDTVKLDIPEDRLIKVLKSNLAYILINRDPPWFKPGSRNYNHSWMRDGALTGEAMLRLGRYDLVKDFVLNFYRFVNAQGWVPFMIMEDGKPCGFNPDMNGGEGHEFDSQGQFVFIVRRYFDFTKDRETLETVYPTVVRALEYGRAIRRMRMTDQYRDTEFWGILPHSNSHEGYFPAKHSYWDDFWMLCGLKDGAYLAEIMGKSEDAAWMREEEEDLRQCLLDSIARVVKKYNLSNIPGCADLGDEDPTSTSIAVIACDETEYLPRDLLLSTFERYQHRIAGRYRGMRDSFTPYEARNADVFFRLGWRDRGLALVRYLAYDCTRPPAWNHLAEVVHAEYRAPSYIGDMPHTWVGSDLINAMLSMFAYEQGDTLVVGAGVDPDWAEKRIVVENLPTRFGTVGYRLETTGDTIKLSLGGEARPPQGVVWVVPRNWLHCSVTINGQPAEFKDGTVRVDSVPAVIELRPNNVVEETAEPTASEFDSQM